MKNWDGFSAILHERLAASARANEREDCTVIALSIAAGLPYDVAHGMLEREGRKAGDGVQFHFAMAHMTALGTKTLCGYKVTPRSCGPKGRTVTQVLRDFPNGRLICCTKDHAFAVIDGTKHDYATGTRDRVRALYLFERA